MSRCRSAAALAACLMRDLIRAWCAALTASARFYLGSSCISLCRHRCAWTFAFVGAHLMFGMLRGYACLGDQRDCTLMKGCSWLSVHGQGLTLHLPLKQLQPRPRRLLQPVHGTLCMLHDQPVRALQS